MREIFYHGSPVKDITKFYDFETNWFTNTYDYAKLYTNGLGCVYHCELNIKNCFDFGRTGYVVFLNPRKLTSYVKDIMSKIPLSEDEILKLCDETIEEGWVDNRMKMKISSIVRTRAFRKIMMNKGYDCIKTLEYCYDINGYAECYGMFNNNDIKIVDKDIIINNELKKQDKDLKESLNESKLIKNKTIKYKSIYDGNDYEYISTTYTPRQDSKYKRLIVKPINTLTFEEVKYIFKIHLAWYYQNVEWFNDTDDVKLNSWVDEHNDELRECQEWLHSLKFPLTIYRAIRVGEYKSSEYNPTKDELVLSGKQRSYSWTPNINIYKNDRSKFRNSTDIYACEIDSNIIDVENTINNFVYYTSSKNISGYGEYEITLKSHFKMSDLHNLRKINKEEVEEDLTTQQEKNIEENLFTAGKAALGKTKYNLYNPGGEGKRRKSKTVNDNTYIDIHHINGNHNEKPTKDNCIIVTRKMHNAIHNEIFKRLIDTFKENVQKIRPDIDDEILIDILKWISYSTREKTFNNKKSEINSEYNSVYSKFRDVINIFKKVEKEYENVATKVANEFKENPDYANDWIYFEESLQESQQVNEIKPYTCGYVLEDGSLMEMDEYHGEDESLRDKGYPEYSNTHPEEDTCIRIYKEPNKNQYEKLEKIIDKYLDWESYCKLEIWTDKKHYDFYKVYSLYDGACQDSSWEEKVGNWTGYDLVKIIKQYFINSKHNNELDEKIVKKGSKWQVQSERGRNLGIFSNKKDAIRRLHQIEYFKNRDKKNEK